MHIGLIGGIGPAATDFYYRRLIATFASRKTPLELTIAHADTPTLLKNLASSDKAAQATIFTRLTKRLAAAGSNCVAITSIAGHFCMDAFKAVSPLPAVDMIVEVNRAIAERGLSRVGILGTQTVMETRFYGGVTSAQIIPPRGQDLLDVHQACDNGGLRRRDRRSAISLRCGQSSAAQRTTALRRSCLGGLILCWFTMSEPRTSR